MPPATIPAAFCADCQTAPSWAPQWQFWRDHRGAEIDLISPDALGNAVALECKSGETWALDWDTELRQMHERFASAGRQLRGAVVYGGTESRTSGRVDGVATVAWRDVSGWLKGVRQFAQAAQPLPAQSE